MHTRVAAGLAEVEPDRRGFWQDQFRKALEAGLVMAGRISAAAGTAINVTWINCFVQPVADCISAEDDNGLPGIYEALREATETLRRGGGVGYDFSRIRPRGAMVHGTGSTASGPVSYMRVFDRSCETVESAGVRRGAQMGILRVDHPDIREFIAAKDTVGELTNFNLSVGVTDAFMKAVRDDTEFDLAHVARPSEKRMTNGVTQRVDGLWVYDRVRARELFELITRSTYDHGEPGIFFLDRVREENNLAYAEEINACNPCADTAAAVLRLLLPGEHQPHAVRRAPVCARREVRFRALRRGGEGGRADAGQRAGRHDVAAGGAAPGGDEQAPDRVGVSGSWVRRW